jgi:D-lactate dehydrogenase (cytochrome)
MLIVKAIILFNDKQKALAEEVVHRMVVNAVEMEGTVTGEHGVGLIKRDYLPHELGETTVDVMRKVSNPSPLSIYNTDVFQVEIRVGSVVSA